MGINQRDVFILPHPISRSPGERHPFIVLSANFNERTFVAVMMTSSEITNDVYSFDLENSMFEHDLAKTNCHIRMHLLTLCLDEEIIGQRVNRMKELHFRELMKSIGDLIFNYSFEPL